MSNHSTRARAYAFQPSVAAAQTGRPRKLTQPVQDALCDAVLNGATLLEAGQQVGVSDDTIARERARSFSFAENLKKATELRAELWAEQVVWETDELPENCTHAHINRQRLRNGSGGHQKEMMTAPSIAHDETFSVAMRTHLILLIDV